MNAPVQPEPGHIYKLDSESILDHLRAAARSWIVASRRDDGSGPVTVNCRSFRKLAARLHAQELRTGAVEPGHVVDIFEWVIGGWRLLETLPRLHTASCEGSKEIVWGHGAEPIALVQFERRGGWSLWPLTDASTGQFSLPDNRKDAYHYTRAEAVAAARRLSDDEPIEDPDWPERWRRALRVTRAAGGATLSLPMEFLGPTGLPCDYPDCTTEAETRVSLSGSDIAVERPHLCCYDHAGQVSAPMIRPDA